MEDFGAPEAYLEKIGYLLGQQVYAGETRSEARPPHSSTHFSAHPETLVSWSFVTDTSPKPHPNTRLLHTRSARVEPRRGEVAMGLCGSGGFAANKVSQAAVLDVFTKQNKGKTYYYYEVLTRTADGDEGGRHQLIAATVSDGRARRMRVVFVFSKFIEPQGASHGELNQTSPPFQAGRP